MGEQDKRRHTRVVLSTRVDLRFDDREMLQCDAEDLCLSGMWVRADHERYPGDQCEIVFHRSGMMQNRPLTLRGEVIRVNDEGLALLFTDMNYRAYTSLQTVLLDNAENPFEVAEEFIDRLPADQ